MMLYQNMKAMLRSPDGDTDFFDIVAGVLQGDTLAPYLFIICLDYLLQTYVNLMTLYINVFTLKKRRLYLAESMTEAGYADYPAFLANTPVQAESLLHSRKQETGSIGLYVNISKTKFMCFRLKKSHLYFKWQASKISRQVLITRQQYIIYRNWCQHSLVKMWTAIDRLWFIWKFDLTNKITWIFFQIVAMSILRNGCTTWTQTKHKE